MAERRKRIGLIVPSSNTSVETDFQRAAPPDVFIHSARMWITEAYIDAIEKMNEEAETCAKYLASAGVDVIAYGCTSGSFLGGPGFDKKLLQRLTEAAGGIPAVATSAAALEALRLLGIHKLSVTSPYPDPVNEKLRAFFGGSGFEILSLNGQRLIANSDIGAQTPDTIREFTKENLVPEAEGMFLSCTNWRAMEAVDRLEKETGKPAVTANQATVWAAFRAVGVTEPIKGYGRLMEGLGTLVTA